MLYQAPPSFSTPYTNQSVGSVSATIGTVLTAGAAHTMGSWTEIVLLPSNRDVDLDLLYLTFTTATSGTRNAFVDIGYGPTSSSVQTVISRLCASSAGTGVTEMGRTYTVPVRIPQGYSVFARVQCTTASATFGVHVTGYGAGRGIEFSNVCSYVEAIGYVDASTTGVAMTCGASGAEGAWQEIVASSTNAYVGFLLGHSVVDSAMSATAYVFDIGAGPNGAERILGENSLRAFHDAGENINSYCNTVFCSVPSGSRLLVRGSCSGTADTNISVILYGMVR